MTKSSPRLSPRDTAEPDPNDAPTLAPRCSLCGGTRPPFGQGPEAQRRDCEMTPACKSTMDREAKALTAWWEDFEARRRVAAGTGIAITWHWHDAARRWVRG